MIVVERAWSFRGLRAERRERDRLSSTKRAEGRDGRGSNGLRYLETQKRKLILDFFTEEIVENFISKKAWNIITF